MVFGVGLNVPFGIETEWANPDQFSGLYMSHRASLGGFGVNPTLAIKLADRLAVGAGLDVRFSTVTLERRVPVINPFTQKPVDAAAERLDAGTSVGVGFDVGVLAKLSDDLSVGASYRHRVKVDYTGTASFTPIPTGNAQLDARVLTVLPSQNLALTSSITFPAFASGGVAYRRGDWVFEADVNWYQWSAFQAIPVTFPDRADLSGAITENYRNSFFYDVQISGRIWNDTNANGLQDRGEAPVAGQWVYIFDDEGNGIDNAQTDANGNYKFTDVQAGRYFLSTDLPTGWRATTPPPSMIWVTKGEYFRKNNFGETPIVATPLAFSQPRVFTPLELDSQAPVFTMENQILGNGVTVAQQTLDLLV